MTQIAFIGGGNMATAIIGGLMAQGDFVASKVRVCDPDEEKRRRLNAQYGVTTCATNEEAIEGAELVILAVKPQVMKEVLEPVKEQLSAQQPVVLSIAAGISIDRIRNWTGCESVVRCMPNTPALVRECASALVAAEQVSDEQKKLANRVMEAAGITVWLDQESDIDAVTALSGSGPAYYFLLMEAMIASGVKLGLSEDVSRKLTLQTAMGAGKMATRSDVTPDELRRRVTSPGGTTEQALFTFEGAHLRDIVDAAMAAAHSRSIELNEQSDQD
ncbi:MAG: pyrroline-5-carboxylate reductase [Oceanobacter sp.]